MTERKKEAANDLVFNEAQLLLAEKRTALASLRTGIAVFALPLSVLSVLVATSKYYDVARVIHFLFPLLALCLGLVALGTYLVVQSIRRIRNYDRWLNQLKQKYISIAEFLS